MKLLALVNLLNEMIDDAEDPCVVRIGQMSKDDRIKKIIALRRIYFQKDVSAKGVLEASARKEFNEKYTSEVSGVLSGDILFKKEIYSLSENVLNLQRYN